MEFGEVINDGGTHDYDELDNQPQINGHTLEGNKTGEQLGLQDKINDLNTIRSGATKGATAVQPEDLARIATTGSYNDSLDKPSVNNVALIGNISLDALGIQPKGNYALESEIPDVSNFITNTVDNLVNYYKKSETFTKQEVNDLISAITTMDIRVVQTLPTEDISTTTIYFVPKTTAGTNDVYDEYVYVSNAWEHIGSTDIDLSGYQTKIDSSHKLSSDLVDDTNQTNKFVTENEKTTWNTEIENLQEEDELLKRNLQTTTGSGEEVTLEKTTELDFVKPPLPRGNTKQDTPPSPDYPQEVEVVTGNVGVTISNGSNTESKTLPVSLGNIELCKIGNYQDYLYKNNGKWYKYGVIGKLTITSVTSIGTASTGIKYALVRSVSVASAGSFIYCSNYVNSTDSTKNNSIRFSGINLYVYDNRFTDYTTALNLLNGLEYYCVLATPTITEITDTTLISQLEEISKTLSYQGQTNITSNTIALFDVEAYQDLKIILEDISNELDTIYKAFPTDTASGAVASFTDGADNLPLKSLVVNINPIQDTSQGDPSPENICPISGWTGANVMRTGKNLLPMEIQSGSYSYGTTITVNPDLSITYNKPNGNGWTANALGTFWLPAGTYTLIEDGDSAQNGRISLKKLPSNTEIVNTRWTKRVTFTLTEATQIYADYSRAAQATDVIIKFMIFKGDTATASDYEPYAGRHVQVSWQTEAGTVYGGTLDVTTGKLTVDRAMVDLGAKNWYSSTAAGRTRFRTSITDIERISSPNVRASLLCSNYPTKTANQTYQGITGVSLQQNEADIYIYDPQTESMTTAEFKSAMSGVQLVYKLATPQTYQLTPTEVTTLLGDNTIWANTGDTTAEYRADTKLYINKMIGDAETISTRLASGGRETALYKGAINPIETNIPLEEEEGVEYEKT